MYIKIAEIFTFYDFEQWINNKTCAFYRSFKCNILSAKCPVMLSSYNTDKHMDVTRILFSYSNAMSRLDIFYSKITIITALGDSINAAIIECIKLAL